MHKALGSTESNCKEILSYPRNLWSDPPLGFWWVWLGLLGISALMSNTFRRFILLEKIALFPSENATFQHPETRAFTCFHQHTSLNAHFQSLRRIFQIPCPSQIQLKLSSCPCSGGSCFEHVIERGICISKSLLESRWRSHESGNGDVVENSHGRPLIPPELTWSLLCRAWATLAIWPNNVLLIRYCGKVTWVENSEHHKCHIVPRLSKHLQGHQDSMPPRQKTTVTGFVTTSMLLGSPHLRHVSRISCFKSRSFIPLNNYDGHNDVNKHDIGWVILSLILDAAVFCRRNQNFGKGNPWRA